MSTFDPKPPTETLAPARNFTITLGDRVRALIGPPAYIRRRRRIEDLEQSLVTSIVEALEVLKAEQPDAMDVDLIDDVRARTGTRRLALMNDLIDRHNRYYPMEANLPVDPWSGVYLDLGQPWNPLRPVTFEELFAKARNAAPTTDDVASR